MTTDATFAPGLPDDLPARLAAAALFLPFAAVENDEQMLDFWRSVPAGMEEPFMQAVAELIAQAEQAGDADTVAHLRPRLAGFRQIHADSQQAAKLPPAAQAVIAFVQAEDDAAAEAFFAQQKHLLQPYEAQQTLDMLLDQAPVDVPTEVRERLAARRALLRRLRGAAPAAPPPPLSPSPLPPSPLSHVSGDLYQAGRDQHFFSAHAESGGSATVVNNLFIQSLERRWTRPAPPPLARDAVPRGQEMQAVLDALAQRENAVITGQVVRSPALAVQGAPGVGKTTLAHLLALHLAEEERYRDGVIWLELGPDFRRADQAQAMLRTWASYATGYFGLPDNLNQLFVFEPAAVRSLLAEHPRLLVVLDNVWSLAAIGPLREALPAGSHLIVTTRQRELAHQMGGGLVEVGLLSPEEALALFELRLGWQPPADPDGQGWPARLTQAVGRHALGLDVALGVLRRYGDAPADWQGAAQALMDAVARGEVERLHLGADDPGHNVKAVIYFSYAALRDDESRRRLLGLAAFAAEAEFSSALAAAAWGCAEESAFESLTDFANASLLERLGGGRWRQHGLLRAFGRALLRDAGETEAAAAAHARAYRDVMQAAEAEQRYYQMRPALPQLAHAFDWAAANDLELALDIAENCANLYVQFGLARQAGEWSERLLKAAQAGRAGPATLARAYGHRANLLSEIATLPGEERRARLLQALDAYDDALKYRRPEVAPLAYAMTQGNLANLHAALAELPEEDRRARQRQSVQAVTIALDFFQQLEHAIYVSQAQRQADRLRQRFGPDVFDALWDELGLGAPLEGFDQAADMAALLNAFVQIQDAEQMIAFWQAVPSDVEEAFIEAVETLIAQVEQAGDADTAAHLQSRLEGFRQIRQGAAATLAAGEPILALLQAYQAALQAADAEQPQVAPWQAVVDLGEQLLAIQPEAEALLDWDALRQQVANDCNTLGNAHDAAGDPAAALAAFERAIAWQPAFAMYRRNQASALIDLGRLAAAAAAIAAARALEPDAPRLAQLDARLAAARGVAGE